MSDRTERMLPLYEAKMIHHYDHRWATYEPDGSTRDVTLAEKQDSDIAALPRYWVRESVVRDRLEGRWDCDWVLGWRRVARSTDERTLISAIVPEAAFGDSIFLMLPTSDSLLGPALQAMLSSFVLDFAARQKIGGTNASFFLIEQLPVPALEALRHPTPWDADIPLGTWLGSRAEAVAADFSQTRDARRVELDAAMFHIFGVARDDVDHIMETFPIVKRKNEAAFGEYRTKRLILEIYDAMSAAIASGRPFVSRVELDAIR
jgi:hypothetical protein